MTEDDAATSATNLQNQALKPLTHHHKDDVSDVLIDNTGSTCLSKAAKMTAEALQAVKKYHQLAFKEQAESFALQLKEFKNMKAQLLQLQE